MARTRSHGSSGWASHGYFNRAGRLLFVLALVMAASFFAPRTGPTRAATPAIWARQIAVNDLPPSRSQYGMAGDAAGNVYVFGGRGVDGTPLNDFWCWHGRTHSWQRLSNNGMPALVEPHLAVDGAGAVYEFGGIDGGQGGADPPGTGHFSADGHSAGLYEYLPRENRWTDLTPPGAQPGVSWPIGREDFGLAYDPLTNSLWVFAGEGPGDGSLNDMWRYALATHAWTRVAPRFSAPAGAQIDAREIYALSYDGHGGLYLFGGAYVEGADHHYLRWRYINDLWRFDILGQRWTLLAGQANAYDPSMPLPRHYFGQATDAAGNFYVLGGYVSDIVHPHDSLPFFNDDLYGLYAQVVAFANNAAATGDIAYAVDDFWRFDPATHAWVDLSDRLGELGSDPFIPYVMVTDPSTNTLITFGGYHMDGDGLLSTSSQVWTYPLGSS